MRELQLNLNQTQKIRLDKSLQIIKSLSSITNSDASVAVADTIPVNLEDNILKGHGTYDLGGELLATQCGVVERVNALVRIRPLKSRYIRPEIGDIVVGRVIEIAPKRWRIDINFTQDAILMLSSMNTPDGIQRRKTALDELNMRSTFEENDVICAEVRGQQHDGLHLQARSQKYGKLEKGQLLIVPPYLVKKRKQHFHHLEQYGIDLILGCNGFIWVGEHVDIRDPMAVDMENKSDDQNSISDKKFMSIEEQESTYTPLETRQTICRIANAVRLLSSLGFTITAELIMEVVELSMAQKVDDIHEMLGAEFYVRVAENEVERRRSSGKRKL